MVASMKTTQDANQTIELYVHRTCATQNKWKCLFFNSIQRKYLKIYAETDIKQNIYKTNVFLCC